MISGVEIVGVAAAALQFAQFIGNTIIFINQYKDAGEEYNRRLAELHSKFQTFQSTLESLSEAAETIELSTHRTARESHALARMKRGLDDSYHTLDALFGCWGKLRKPGNHSSLRHVVDYWFYQNEGRAVVDRGIVEIGDRVKSIESALLAIQTHALYDSRDAVYALHDRQILSTPCDSGYDTKTLCNTYEVTWNLDLLVDNKAVSEALELSDALVSAINNKNSGLVAVLLENGNDPLAKDMDGWCALHYAVRTGSRSVMRKLLHSKELKHDRKGVDKRNQHGATPLHFASSIGMESMAKELLKAGADRNAVDNHNRSPLFVAVEQKQERMFELLSDQGAKLLPSIPARYKKMHNALMYRKGIAAKAKG